jgi:hypothetical protein
MNKLLAKPPESIVPRQLTILVYGEPCAGKTMGALGWPKPYLIDTEGGCTQPAYATRLAKSKGAYLGPDEGATDFSVVRSQVEALATTKHAFQTLVIDSFTKLFAVTVADEWERKRSRGENMSATYGSEKRPAINLTRQLIRQLDRLNMTTLLICHETTVWHNGQIIGSTHDGWDKLEYELDLVAQIVANGSQRLAKIGKSRLSQFPKGAAFPWSYDEFAKRLATQGNGG